MTWSGFVSASSHLLDNVPFSNELFGSAFTIQPGTPFKCKLSLKLLKTLTNLNTNLKLQGLEGGVWIPHSRSYFIRIPHPVIFKSLSRIPFFFFKKKQLFLQILTTSLTDPKTKVDLRTFWVSTVVARLLSASLQFRLTHLIYIWTYGARFSQHVEAWVSVSINKRNLPGTWLIDTTFCCCCCCCLKGDTTQRSPG